MSAQLKQGENFVLNMTLTDDDGNPLPVADFASYTVKALNQGRTIKTWTWLPDDAGDPYLRLTEGLAELEVATVITASILGHISFQVLPAFIDTDYFVAGAQTDVVCFDNLVYISQC